MSSTPTNSYLAAFVFMIDVVYFFSRSDDIRYSSLTFAKGIDTLSLVSKYLNGMEDILDDGDSLEARKIIVRKRLLCLKNAPPRAYSKPFTRFSLPCDVNGQDYGKYGRKMVKEVCVEIHGFTFLVDFVVIGYANEGEPLVIFGRDFLVTSKSRVDFGIGEMRYDLTMLEEMKDIDVMLDAIVENLEEVEKVKEALDRKYKELEESKPILEVLENYMTYRKNLDEVLMGRAGLSRDDYVKEVKMRIVKHGLPKKMCDPGNFVLPVKVNRTIEMNALVDTGKATQGSHLNPLIANFEKRNKQGTIEYHLQQVKNANLKWRELPLVERHTYCERLSKFQGKVFGIPRVPSWTLFYGYNIEETLKNKMKYEYIPDDGDDFVDYSWERDLSIYGDVYPKWCLEFFLTMYSDKGVDRTKLMTKKCIWFRLCGVEKVLTLPEFAILLGLYKEDKLTHRLFAIHFTRLEVDDKLFNHEAF
ncbi:hypothetical protein Tco_0157203 [Tanacetum coccineum]